MFSDTKIIQGKTYRRVSVNLSKPEADRIAKELRKTRGLIKVVPLPTGAGKTTYSLFYHK